MVRMIKYGSDWSTGSFVGIIRCWTFIRIELSFKMSRTLVVCRGFSVSFRGYRVFWPVFSAGTRVLLFLELWNVTFFSLLGKAFGESGEILRKRVILVLCWTLCIQLHNSFAVLPCAISFRIQMHLRVVPAYRCSLLVNLRRWSTAMQMQNARMGYHSRSVGSIVLVPSASRLGPCCNTWIVISTTDAGTPEIQQKLLITLRSSGGKGGKGWCKFDIFTCVKLLTVLRSGEEKTQKSCVDFESYI